MGIRDSLFTTLAVALYVQNVHAAGDIRDTRPWNLMCVVIMLIYVDKIQEKYNNLFAAKSF